MADNFTNGDHAINFSMVRFGNVLGSSGSVAPLFSAQIKAGGPITLTHPEVTRYFMTIPEAAQLVIQSSAMATGGDVFVLDMGEPVRIYDLAVKMIYLSGLLIKDETHPHGDIEIKVTGLRSGEKLYEELLIGENPQGTAHPKIMKAHEEFLSWDELQQELEKLNLALDSSDDQLIRDMLKKLVPGYQPNGAPVDWKGGGIFLNYERPII
jgi:FlaA1/EpsC-like NDP-sugar epimerase